MNRDIMKTAIQHFYRQNYYAARDLWNQALVDNEDEEQVAACNNALGAVYDRIRGTDFSRPYFERAVELEDGQPLSELGLKARTNLVHVLTRSGHIDAALQVIRETEQLKHANYVGSQLRWALFEVSVLNAFSRAELYDEILQRAQHVAELFKQLDTSEVRDRHLASLYQYAGYAAYMTYRQDLAIHYYQQALATSPTPDVWRDLAKVYLVTGATGDAVACLSQLYPLIWRLTTVTEKIELAYTLELLAMFAWMDKEQVLFKKCAEKAELYFGQESRWTEWLQMQSLESNLAEMNLEGPRTQMVWEPWNGFLDELNLLDGFNTMFPAMWSILRYTALLASRIYSECRGVGEAEELQTLERATRLAYVGLTALAVSEREIEPILCNQHSCQQLAMITVKLLETYPYTEPYQGILKSCRQHQLHPASRTEYMSASLGIALHYVELVEFHHMSHRTALEQLVQDYSDGPRDVVIAFVQLFDV